MKIQKMIQMIMKNNYNIGDFMYYLYNSNNKVVKIGDNFQTLFNELLEMDGFGVIPEIKDQNHFTFYSDGTGSGFTCLLQKHESVIVGNKKLSDLLHPQLKSSRSLYKQSKLDWMDIKNKADHITLFLSRKHAWLFIERLKELRNNGELQ